MTAAKVAIAIDRNDCRASLARLAEAWVLKGIGSELRVNGFKVLNLRFTVGDAALCRIDPKINIRREPLSQGSNGGKLLGEADHTDTDSNSSLVGSVYLCDKFLRVTPVSVVCRPQTDLAGITCINPVDGTTEIGLNGRNLEMGQVAKSL